MKNKLMLLLLLLVGAVSSSQNWVTDIDVAKKIASEENKKIILVFQGSDWCAPCIKLDHEIWSTSEFKEYAKDHYVMLKADFPRSKKNALPKEQQIKNGKLAEKYNKNGYPPPLVVILDKTGKALGMTGYKKISPNEYIAKINSF